MLGLEYGRYLGLRSFRPDVSGWVRAARLLCCRLKWGFCGLCIILWCPRRLVPCFSVTVADILCLCFMVLLVLVMVRLVLGLVVTYRLGSRALCLSDLTRLMTSALRLMRYVYVILLFLVRFPST